MDGQRVLLSGVTGFLGREILYELLATTDCDVVCLVRAEDGVAAQRRLEKAWEEICGEGSFADVRDRVRAVRADVTLPAFGLTPEQRRELTGSVTHVIHGAATVRFDLPMDVARRINGMGTANVLGFANDAQRFGRLQRVGYVSTAFVAGTATRDWFAETDLDVGQGFRNSYERSKFEAELLVHTYDKRLPVTVVRPSIVVGHSRSGATTAFNTLYWPLRVFSSGVWRHAPVRSDTLVDAVPVDYVARGTVEAVLGRGEAGATYTLASGRNAPTAGEIGRLAGEVFDCAPPMLVHTPLDRLVLPLLAQAMRGPAGRFGRAYRSYLPYFFSMPRFDTSQAHALLLPAGITAPPPEEFLVPILEFARDTGFGRDRAAIERRLREVARERRRTFRSLVGRSARPAKRRAPARSAR